MWFEDDKGQSETFSEKEESSAVGKKNDDPSRIEATIRLKLQSLCKKGKAQG